MIPRLVNNFKTMCTDFVEHMRFKDAWKFMKDRTCRQIIYTASKNSYCTHIMEKHSKQSFKLSWTNQGCYMGSLRSFEMFMFDVTLFNFFFLNSIIKMFCMTRDMYVVWVNTIYKLIFQFGYSLIIFNGLISGLSLQTSSPISSIERANI